MIDKNIREVLSAFGVITLAVIITFTIGFFVGTNYYPNIKVVENNITNTITIQKELQPIITNNDYSNYTTKNVYYEMKSEFMNIIKENYEYRDYEKRVWDCINITSRLTQNLKQKGYLAEDLSTFIKDKNEAHLITGVYLFVDGTSNKIIPPSEYGYFGIDAGLVREWNITESNLYSEQEELNKDSFQICKGLK